MPKIGTTMITVKNKMTSFDVYYTQKEGFYLKDFPAEILKFSREGYKPRQDSEHNMKVWYMSTTKLYHDALKKIRKVIAVKLQLSMMYTHKKTSDNSWKHREDINSKFSSKTSFDGSDSWKHQMRFDFQILFIEERDEVVDSYFMCNPDGTIGHRTGERDVSFLLDYSEERLAFCQSIENNLIQLAEKFIQFFQQPIDELTKAIDTGGKLLLNS